MSFSYNLRAKKLDIICKNSKLKKYSDLISYGQIDRKHFSYIQNASKNLLHACLLGNARKVPVEIDFDKVINEIKKNKPDNITHNGLVVPRKEISIEYALFTKSVFCLLEYLGLNKFIDFFVSPPQLRIKLGNISNNFNASENIHSDAWTPYNTDKSYTFYLPIYGDCKKNFVKFFKPKNIKDFDPSWLKPKKFIEGKKIAEMYKETKLQYKLGSFVMSDCATLHQSVLKRGAKPRVSIDIAFIPKNIFRKSTNISHVKKDKIKDIGYNQIMVFKDSFNDSLKKILSRQSKDYNKTKASTYNRYLVKF